jgi:hydroxyethylthiazole kinase-like uncharacterized protein yjeF
MSVVTKGILNTVYPERRPDAHKTDFGHLLIVGGSRRYMGSAPALAALAALAALRGGVDLVTVAVPEIAATAVAAYSPNYITVPLNGQQLTTSNLQQIINLAEKATAFVIGNGLSKEKKSLTLAMRFVAKTKLPGVVDADALDIFEDRKLGRENLVLTPHAGEFERLTGKDVSEVTFEEQKAAVKHLAQELNATVVLKGEVDYITNGQAAAINNTGNAYMTVGGTGDVLAGLIGAFLAQGTEPFIAAQAGAYINGVAGDQAAKIKKQALVATDIIDTIPQVL